jgi:Nucleotidyl transferase AbiEii toxin, Type IV TA system
MSLSPLHQRVAEIALRAAAGHGFALGGGNALIAHGVISRPTQDVDLFTDDEAGVAAVADAVEAALQDAGFETARQDMTAGLGDIWEGMGEGLAEWVITAPDGQEMLLQLAYFDRAGQPVVMDVGPVLGIEDVVGGKACALASRAEPRDYWDMAAALSRYSVGQVISFARRLDPGLEDRDFADAGRRLDRWDDSAFEILGVSQRDIATVRERFRGWPRG